MSDKIIHVEENIQNLLHPSHRPSVCIISWEARKGSKGWKPGNGDFVFLCNSTKTWDGFSKELKSPPFHINTHNPPFMDEEYLKSFVKGHNHEIGPNYAAYNSSKYARILSTLPLTSPSSILIHCILFLSSINSFFLSFSLFSMLFFGSLRFTFLPLIYIFFNFSFLAKNKKYCWRILKATKRSTDKTMGIKIR